MMNNKSIDLAYYSKNSVKNERRSVVIKTIVLLLELGLIAALLVLWLGSESIRASKSIWILFFYNFPSQFLIALVPHEPVFIYFSKFYSPIVVTFVCIAGTLVTESLNYSVFFYFADLKSFQKFRNSKAVNYLISLFNKAPFLALLIAGFTPVPFYPFRFLVVLANYSVMKYLTAVFLSRTPRFYLIALIGKSLELSDTIIIIIFVIIGILIYIPLLKNYVKKTDRMSKEKVD
jgi:membrane protein YqaA with SNARE-associated domain